MAALSIISMNHSPKNQRDMEEIYTQDELDCGAAMEALRNADPEGWEKWYDANVKNGTYRQITAQVLARVEELKCRPVITGDYLTSVILNAPLYFFGGELHEVCTTPAGDTSRNDEIPF